MALIEDFDKKAEEFLKPASDVHESVGNGESGVHASPDKPEMEEPLGGIMEMPSDEDDE